MPSFRNKKKDPETVRLPTPPEIGDVKTVRLPAPAEIDEAKTVRLPSLSENDSQETVIIPTSGDTETVIITTVEGVGDPGDIRISLSALQDEPDAPSASEKKREIEYYAIWLKQQAAMVDSQEKINEAKSYADRAAQAIKVSGQRLYPFSPLRPERSAVQTITNGQLIGIFLLVIVWALGLIFFGVPTLVITVAAITFFYAGNLFNTFRLVLGTLDVPSEEHIGDDIVMALQGAQWPDYTILCPLYHEANIVPQFIHAMSALDYPTHHLQILFLTEADDEETRHAIRKMHLPPHFQIVTVPDGGPRTKPHACNYGLMQATGDYIVIYDAEDIPDPLQLKKSVLTFANKPADVACVQAKLNFYNSRQNLITRWFSLEYLLWFDLVLPGMQSRRLSMPLGGTSNHFRTSLLRKLGAWDPFNVTEDCDLGLRLSHLNLYTAMLDSVTYEEANPQLKNWIRQRSRWIKGYLQTYLVHMRRPWRFLRAKNWREFFSLQFIIGGTPATFFLNPVMWVLLVLYIVLQPVIAGEFHLLYPAPSFYVGMITLVFGNFLYIYIFLIAAMKREHYELMIWTLLIPIYWAMMSIAAIVALYQLVIKPHHWEKTQHGLHLQYVKPHISLDASGVHNSNFR